MAGQLFLCYDIGRKEGGKMYDNPLYNPMLNPYLGAAQPYRQAPRQEVVKVNGENGARAFQLGANSSALLLDESGMVVWLITTDGAGYKTVAPFDITPHAEAPAPDFWDLEARITKLEEMVKNGTSGNLADARTAERTTGKPIAADDRHAERRK